LHIPPIRGISVTRTTAGIQAKRSRSAAGEDVWNGRGKDKQPRGKDGYFKRWQNYRECENEF